MRNTPASRHTEWCRRKTSNSAVAATEPRGDLIDRSDNLQQVRHVVITGNGHARPAFADQARCAAEDPRFVALHIHFEQAHTVQDVVQAHTTHLNRTIRLDPTAHGAVRSERKIALIVGHGQVVQLQPGMSV